MNDPNEPGVFRDLSGLTKLEYTAIQIMAAIIGGRWTRKSCVNDFALAPPMSDAELANNAVGFAEALLKELSAKGVKPSG